MLEDAAGLSCGDDGEWSGGRPLRYRFDAFLLDTSQFRLCHGEAPVHVEPMVFDLLRLFVENAGTVIDRDRLCADVWGGRIVAEATLSTAIKSARRALGDSGAAQGYIETVRGRGYRFTGQVLADAAAEAAAPEPPVPEAPGGVVAGGQPSVAVLPLARVGDPEAFPGLEEALPHEVIVALARLRWLAVIARGSSFRFRGDEPDLGAVGRVLGARYCLTGTLELFGRAMATTVELAECESRAVIWGERFAGTFDDVHGLRAEIIRGVTAALEERIPMREAALAQDRPAENLDAWQAFHLGLRYMHRYTREGNMAAEALFRRAIALQPSFARAHAGLSFTHFQNAFMRYLPDRDKETDRAPRAAERGIENDPLDPFVNFNMGRSFWIRQDLDGAMPWLERATDISPSYAQGLYSRALIDVLSERPGAGIPAAEMAMRLSPLDPLLYAMRATKALALVSEGAHDAAADWADVAARTPRAHLVIEMIAAISHDLAGDEAKARRWTESARAHGREATRGYFFEALPIRPGPLRDTVEKALARRGF